MGGVGECVGGQRAVLSAPAQSAVEEMPMDRVQSSTGGSGPEFRFSVHLATLHKTWILRNVSKWQLLRVIDFYLL